MLNRWEYTQRPLTADTTPAELDALGAEGWELCGIAGGIGWFKRSRVARALHEQGARLAAERDGKFADPTSAGGTLILAPSRSPI